MRPVVGFHDFINSKPLLHAFRHGLVDTPFKLVTDTPSGLSDRFHKGELDIALLPSIEYARAEDAVIIPVACISSLGRVDTVLLFSENAIEDVDSVSVDPKSRTSVAMLRVIFKEKFGKNINVTVARGYTPDDMLRNADAGLVIGDQAFGVDRDKYVVHDLGELWYKFSGRPFVHAVFCAKRGKRWDAAIAAIAEAKTIGLANRRLIAKQESGSHIEEETIYEYLTKRIRYDLGDPEKEGLEYFLARSGKMGLASVTTLKLY